ncbi:MAG: RsiV family protein [Muribaculum sp.]|nr:RsiV family protein [Muribaculum sp.]
MRHLLTVIIGTIVFIAMFMAVDWRDIDLSLSMPSLATESRPLQHDEDDEEYEQKLWIDTIMCASGHSFGYSGDVTMWGGWYYDTIPVGDNPMLSYDSVGPSSLRLSLITHDITVDLGDPKALEKIKNFLAPFDGFKRFHQDYEETLDSIVDEEYTLKCTGYYSFTADYADSCIQNAGLINKFLCDLTGISKSETAKVPGLAAFYAGFNPKKCYRPVYTGNIDNIKGLSDFLANKAFENWKRSGDTDESSNAEKLELRLHVHNHKFVTYGIYEYDRIGIGHGMYTESFSSLDLSTGKAMFNCDIFKSNSLDKVKKLLFEAMFNDKRYREWNQNLESPEDVEARIEGWQSPSAILEGTEWEEPKREVTFELPEGALTESGVVFSFQPYGIGCWAEGAYHFIVPYGKLRPYLTSHANKLIDGVTF